MKKKQENIESDINHLVDICTNIIKQNNIIIYPSSESRSVNTYFNIKIMDENSEPTETIFTINSPSNGYGIKITKTNVHISGYDVPTYIQNKIMKLYHDCEEKSDEQKKLRNKIAEQNYAKLLSEAKQELAKFVFSKSK